jgi:trehalose 6-phosphate synthase
MPLAERVRRWEALMQVVRNTDVGIWRDAFVKTLLAIEGEPEKAQWAGAA